MNAITENQIASMNKVNAREAKRIVQFMDAGMVDTAARAASAAIRACMTTKQRNIMLTFAAGWPALVAHHEFIV